MSNVIIFIYTNEYLKSVNFWNTSCEGFFPIDTVSCVKIRHKSKFFTLYLKIQL